MAYKNKLMVVWALSALLFSCSQSEAPNKANFSPPVDGWPEVQRETRPWARWWWMGNAVDKKNISKLLKEYTEKGIGGVEIAPIYGAMGYEDRYIDFLSPQWMEMLEFTIKTADSLNLGVDMTQGTGWPFGGPHVKPENAASKLIIQKYKLKEGKPLQERIIIKDEKQALLSPVLNAVMAYDDKGGVFNISDKIGADGRLNWSPPAGNWEIIAAWAGRTGQMVKRAAPGGVGYTLDHLSRKAVDGYLDRFEKAFNGNTYGIRAFYNDSYEVYEASWTTDFFEEFQNRRGYDLRPYLRQLVSNDSTDFVIRLKTDYRETMGEMLLENFTTPWTNWAHHHKGITKYQAHGSPGNLLDLYGAVDIPEGETFGSSYFPIPGLRRDSSDIRNVDPDPIMLKFASSAANVMGKKLSSSETFTWLGEHFKTSYSQMKPELEQVFLSGINHVFYHGITYSPEDVAWPGWLFYASLNLTPANSLWPHFKGFNEYVTLSQSVLQAGKPDNELMLYWPVFDVYSTPEGLEKMIKVHDIDEWLHPTQFYKQAKALMEAGYSLDFVSDNMIARSKVTEGKISASDAAPAYKVLVIPQSRFMPLSTIEKIMELVKAGATVILQGLPQDVPGLHKLVERRKTLQQWKESLEFKNVGNGVQQLNSGEGKLLISEDVSKALEYINVHGETLTKTGLKFVRRAVGDDKYYYLVNHTPNQIDTNIELNLTARSVVILDPQSGDIGLAASESTGKTTKVRVQMQPGEALILRTATEGKSEIAAWPYPKEEAEPLVLNEPWELQFTGGGPKLPAATKLNQLISWTDLPDRKAEAFSGTGVYSTTFTLPSKDAEEYILDLGTVRESARVWVNGHEVGVLMSIPYQTRIGKFLKQGDNTLKVEVVNLMANRIRDMDIKGIEWRKYHEINFVNIDYKTFDASVWQPTPSGLLGPVIIRPYGVKKEMGVELN